MSDVENPSRLQGPKWADFLRAKVAKRLSVRPRPSTATKPTNFFVEPLTCREKTLAVFSNFTSVKEIPEMILEKHGYVRVDGRSADRGNYQVLADKSYFFATLRHANNILGQYEGYLFADDRAKLNIFIEHHFLLNCSLGDFYAMERRANELMSAAVPPIFQKAYEGEPAGGRILQDMQGKNIVGLAFPLIDFALEYVSGSYFSNKEEAFLRAGEIVKLKVQPATVEDIRAFRTLAFRDGEIDEAVVNEIVWFIRTRFNFDNYPADQIDPLLEKSRSNILAMAEQLKTLPAGDRAFLPFDRSPGSRNGKIVSKRLFHVQYTPADVEFIVKQAWAKLKPQSKDRFAAIFPTLLPYLTLIQNITEIVPEMAGIQLTEDETKTMLDGTVNIEQIIQLVKDRCETLFEQDPIAVLQPPVTLAGEIKLGATAFDREELYEALYTIKLETLRKIQDQVLIEYFRPPGKIENYKKGMRSRTKIKSEAFPAYRQYLCERLQVIEQQLELAKLPE